MHTATGIGIAGTFQHQSGERTVTRVRTGRIVGIDAVADETPENGSSQETGQPCGRRKLHAGSWQLLSGSERRKLNCSRLDYKARLAEDGVMEAPTAMEK